MREPIPMLCGKVVRREGSLTRAVGVDEKWWREMRSEGREWVYRYLHLIFRQKSQDERYRQMEQHMWQGNTPGS